MSQAWEKHKGNLYAKTNTLKSLINITMVFQWRDHTCTNIGPNSNEWGLDQPPKWGLSNFHWEIRVWCVINNELKIYIGAISSHPWARSDAWSWLASCRYDNHKWRLRKHQSVFRSGLVWFMFTEILIMQSFHVILEAKRS